MTERNDRKLKVRHAIYFVVAVCLSLVAVAIFGSWNSRQHQLHDKEIAMSNLAQTLSSQAEATIKQADTALLGLVERLETDGMSRSQLERMERLLKVQNNELPQLHGIFIYDDKGRWIVNSRGVLPPNANNSDREYFIFHRDHPERGPHIGPSIRSRSTGDWVITVSRRFNHPDGSFAGVVTATLYLKHFLKLYNSIEVGHNGVITLISADAKILVRRPFREADIGSSLINAPLFTQLLPNAPFGTAAVRSHVDGVERIVGYRRVDGYPLVIFAAFEKYEVLSSWRNESLPSAALVLLLLVILGTIGFRLVKLMKHQMHVQGELYITQNQLMKANRALELMALEDALTGLANRREFDKFIKAEAARARRDKNNFSLLMIDVDYFKNYNDHYGHPRGDECLKTLSAIIQKNIVRSNDLAARYGGEEFAVVLPGTDSEGAFLVAEKIRRAVLQAEIQHCDSPEGIITVSIGVSTCIFTRENSPDVLIESADKALYAAKASGKNMSIVVNSLSQVELHLA
ncbi:MAG: sensor domain-containing diguanylate cyclase [Hafnia sp.]